MKSEIGSDLTIQDKRDKIRSQLHHELGLPYTPTKKANESASAIQKPPSKRTKFLSDPKNLKKPGDVSLSWMPPLPKRPRK